MDIGKFYCHSIQEFIKEIVAKAEIPTGDMMQYFPEISKL
jgi:hypothetical protein